MCGFVGPVSRQQCGLVEGESARPRSTDSPRSVDERCRHCTASRVLTADKEATAPPQHIEVYEQQHLCSLKTHRACAMLSWDSFKLEHSPGAGGDNTHRIVPGTPCGIRLSAKPRKTHTHTHTHTHTVRVQLVEPKGDAAPLFQHIDVLESNKVPGPSAHLKLATPLKVKLAGSNLQVRCCCGDLLCRLHGPHLDTAVALQHTDGQGQVEAANREAPCAWPRCTPQAGPWV